MGSKSSGTPSWEGLAVCTFAVMGEVFLGIEHITDPSGYDHMLFLVALAAWADLQHWRKIFLLATAFTLGHSITLALAGFDVVRPHSTWIEFLIPVSIFFTGLYNCRRSLTRKRRSTEPPPGFDGVAYLATTGFGLIHGLGFSSFFRMTRDETSSLVLGLFQFNLGVEIGQVLILLVFLAMASLLRGLGISAREQQLFFAGAAVGLSLIMALERLPI